MESQAAAGVTIPLLQERYGIPRAVKRPTRSLADAAAARHTSGETARMAQRLLDDFRKSASAASPWSCRHESAVETSPLRRRLSPTLWRRGGELLTLAYPKPLPMRLDRWLVSQRTEQSRARIQKFIDAGYAGQRQDRQGQNTLRQGDEVQLWMPPPEPLPYLKPEPMDLDVLFEDDHLIVLNKPAGLTVHPAPGNKDGTLVNGLLHHCPDLPGISGKLRPGIVHRLDKDTTGCIVIAKSQEALVRLQVQIQKRIASREYFAVVHGGPAEIPARSSAPLGHPADRKKYAVVSGENGRYACTTGPWWSVLATTPCCASSSTPGVPIRSASTAPT